MAELGPAGVTLIAFIASILGIIGVFGVTGGFSRGIGRQDVNGRQS
jgi:hypothetical protein